MTSETLRLHIAPFSPDLLRTIVPPKISHLASNISYHSLQTFPENSYGYVELPVMEAEKIQKKLNGSILKGKKIKIEEARPPKRRCEEGQSDVNAGGAGEGANAPGSTSKKAKRDSKLIAGHELSPERKIKRGWTEVKRDKSSKSKDEKSQLPSKFSQNRELLFRTKLPPSNKLESTGKPRRKTKRGTNEVVVHEFEKSTAQPSFLRGDRNSTLAKPANIYVDGKGWVDDAGQVVEEENSRVSKQRVKAASINTSFGRRSGRQNPVAKESSSSSSESELLSEVDRHEEGERKKALRAVRKSAEMVHSDEKESDDPSEDTDETSSSGISSESESISDEKISEDGSNASPQITITTSGSPPGETRGEPHPLEALFKRPHQPASQDIAKPSLEVQTSFSFFDNSSNEMNDDTAVPGTPFGSQDVRSRGLRSAAPTPDTAYPTRYNSYGSSHNEDLREEEGDEGGEEEEDQTRKLRSANQKPKPTASSQQSKFEKAFWEKRGDNNRAWKQRRRETLKEKRQRENRAKKNRNW